MPSLHFFRAKISAVQLKHCGPHGVNGSDFLAWKTEGELAADLRLPPFAARKLLACRAAFLAAA